MRTHHLMAVGHGQGKASTRRGLAHQAELVAAGLPALMIVAERVAATVWQGVHGRYRVGQGEAFWQFRPYQPGEPATRIDWRQSARSDRVYVRETEWEAAQTVWMWRDGSPSMDYRGRDRWPRKLDAANLLIAALAVLLVRGGERIALMGEPFPPATGRAAVERLAAALIRDDVMTGGLPPRAALARYATVVLAGDFLSPADAMRETLATLADRGIRPLLVHITDASEETLPFAGRVLMDGCEGEDSLLFGRIETVRDAYRTAFAAHQEELGRLATGFGGTVIRHRTDQPAAAALLALYLALAPKGRR